MSSKRALRRKMQNTCDRKQPYATWGLAHRAMMSIYHNVNNRGGNLNVYKCPSGNHFHVGHVIGGGILANNVASKRMAVYG
jgi:hypothetical protein